MEMYYFVSQFIYHMLEKALDLTMNIKILVDMQNNPSDFYWKCTKNLFLRHSIYVHRFKIETI